MSRRLRLTKLTSVALLAALAPSPNFAATDERPNIVFILADDLGAVDLQADGAVLAETPALDRLRGQGVSFSSAYASAPICSASRASILTGRSPARLHFEFVTKATEPGATDSKQRLLQPDFPVNLPLSETTISEILGPAGYATGFFGKWHLTQANDRYLGHGTTFGPRQQGFDEADEERGSHPYSWLKPKMLPPPGDFKAGEYEPDALIDRAIEFIGDHRNRRFFLFLSLYHPHEPVNTRLEWLEEKYRRKAARLGLSAGDRSVRYAAFADTMDHLVGRVLAAIDEQTLSGNTLVVFTSDNGGAPQWTDHRPVRGSKWTLYEGGIRVPLIARGPGIPAGVNCPTPVTGTDFLPTFSALAHATLPKDVVFDGANIQPLLAESKAEWSARTLTWHFPFYHEPHVDETPVSAIRRNDLKVVYHYEHDRTELFDLAADPSESRDLSTLR
ncbi:MAG TPA: sulfatase, partial [Opitutus sp.]|nr:sulfatase [Opitutus sp.]